MKIQKNRRIVPGKTVLFTVRGIEVVAQFVGGLFPQSKQGRGSSKAAALADLQRPLEIIPAKPKPKSKPKPKPKPKSKPKPKPKSKPKPKPKSKPKPKPKSKQ